MCIKFRSHSQLVCLDDKHKCKVGEPGLPVAAVERGKQVIVSSNGCKFAVADHDFTKCSVIPSVTLLCETPETIDGSFYQGQVCIGIKDAILEPSSPLRHSTELSKILKQRNSNPAILLLYRDGGPDHNVTFLSVQVSLIALFLIHDLDLLTAVRTAPYQSWKNPCERVNCILNIGLQAVGLMRKVMSNDHEKMISSCSTMDEVRKAVQANQGLKEGLEDSMEPLKILMASVFQRLSLKDKPFSIFTAATAHEMEAFFSYLIDIDANLTPADRSKNCLSQRPELKKFMDHCCFIRKYVFGVKKCGKDDCRICSPPRLPKDIFDQLHHLPDPVADGEHYKTFENVYGCMTTEKDCPSLKNPSKKPHGIPFSPSAQTARKLVLCSECLKPRVVYSRLKLKIDEEYALERTLAGVLFTCGSSLKELEVEHIPSDPLYVQTLMERAFVRENLTCDEPVEVSYYSSEKFQDLCIHCACVADAVEGAYPICQYCKDNGKLLVLKRKRKLFSPH